MANPAKVRTASGTWVDLAVQSPDLSNYSTTTQMNTAIATNSGINIITGTTSTGGTVGSTGAVTFSGVSSVSVNNCFSSTYDNYKILFQGKCSGFVDFFIRLRASGTDNTTASSYVSQRINARSTTSGGSITTNTYWYPVPIGNQDLNIQEYTFFQPFLAAKTGFTCLGSYTGDNNAVLDNYYTVGLHSQTVSYDGFTIYPSSGTITGTLRIYGMKN